MPSTPYPYDPENFAPPLDWRAKFPRQWHGWTPWAILFGILLFFGTVNFSFCWIASDPQQDFWQYWMAFNMGVIGAQAGLLSIYAVFGQQPALERHGIAAAIGLIDLFVWLLGYFLATWLSEYNAFPQNDIDEVVAPMLVVPALFFAGCVPLWMLRTLFRWRIARQMPGQASARPPHLSIAGILAATFVVALSLALVRLGDSLSTNIDEATWWIGTGIAAAFTSVICLLTLPASTWGILRSRSLLLGTFVSVLGLCLFGFGVVLLIRILDGRWPPNEAWTYIILMNGSFIVCLLGPLLAARLYGFRLVVGRGKTSDSPADPGKTDNPALTKIDS